MSRLLQAVILDWAGTTVDHGSLAPMGAFVEAFSRFGIEVTVAEARGPMGRAKRPHVEMLMRLPRVSEAWRDRHGREPTEADIDAVYDAFVPLNIACVDRYADLIPGTATTVNALRSLGLKIGSSTGYTREIMARILPLAAAQGYAPDALVCTGDTPEGRPTPFMMYRCLLELGVWPAWTCVKVDDTEVGIAEGLNAGAWSVGVAMTGNLVGLTAAELGALPAVERAALRHHAAGRLAAAGAHEVVDSIADLLPALHRIEGRLRRGERP